jgi:hypothetical protein
LLAKSPFGVYKVIRDLHLSSMGIFVMDLYQFSEFLEGAFEFSLENVLELVDKLGERRGRFYTLDWFSRVIWEFKFWGKMDKRGWWEMKVRLIYRKEDWKIGEYWNCRWKCDEWRKISKHFWVSHPRNYTKQMEHWQ